jgi:hypothetical protein
MPVPDPDPDPDPDRASQLLRLAELPRALVEGKLSGTGSASIVGGFVRMTRPQAAARRRTTRIRRERHQAR